MTTTLAVLHLELNVVQAQSLKDKRRAVKSFKDRIRNGHNVSIAEVGALDHRQRAVLAVAMVGSDRTYVEGALQRIVNAAATHRDMILTNQDVEWL
jgi:uncharacterized protein YlxP (DUF503 family)